MSGNYDGTIVFNTKIDDSDLAGQIQDLGKRAENSFAKLRDVMQGPIAAFKEISRVAGQVGNVISGLESEWAAQESAIAILNSTLKATGAEAWTSSSKVQQLASDLQKVTGYADENVLAMENVLLGFKNIKGDNFQEATVQILNMAKVMGMDLTSAAQAAGKALDDPIAGVDSLTRQGFRFSDSQKETLKSLVETGNIAKAQKIILDELATTYGGAAEAANNTASAVSAKLGVAVSELKEELGRFVTESLKPMRESLINTVDSLTAFFKNINENAGAKEQIKNIAVAVEALTAAVAAFIVVSKGKAAIDGLTVAIGALNAVLAGNIWALAFAAITAGVIALIGVHQNHIDKLNEEIDSYQKTVDEADKLAKEYETLATKQNLSQTEQSKLDELTASLLKQYPNLTTETLKLAAANGTLAEKITEAATASAKKAAIEKLPSLESEYAQTSKELANYSSVLEGLKKTPPGGTFLGISTTEIGTYEKYIAALEKELNRLYTEIETNKQILYGIPKPTASKPLPPPPGGAGVASKPKPQGEQLKDLDVEYQARIDLAKKMGEDTFSVEQEWAQKRYDMLKGFVLEDVKNGLTVEKSLVTDLAGSYGTLGNELTKAGDKLKTYDKTISNTSTADYLKELNNQAVIDSLSAQEEWRVKSLQEGVKNQEAKEAQAQEEAGFLKDLNNQAAIDVMTSQNNLNVESLKIGAERVQEQEAQAEESADFLKSIENQKVIDAMTAQNDLNLESLKIGAQRVKEQEDQAQAEADFYKELADKTAIETLSAETAWQVESLNIGAQLVKDREEQAQAAADYVKDLDNQAAQDALQAQNDFNVESLKIGAQLIKDREDQAKAFADYVTEVANQAIIDAKSDETAQQLESLKIGVERLPMTQLTKSIETVTDSFNNQIATIKATNWATDEWIESTINAAREAGVSEEAIQKLQDAYNGLQKAQSAKTVSDYTKQLRDNITAIELQNQGLDANFEKILADARATGATAEELQNLIGLYKQYQVLLGKRPFLDISAGELDKIGQSIGAISNALSALSTDSSAVFQQMASVLINAIKVYETGGSDIAAIGELLNNIIALAGSADLESFSKLQEQINQIASTLLDALSPILDKIIANISNIFSIIEPFITILNIATQLMAAVQQVLQPIVSGMLPLLVSGLNFLAKVIAQLYNAVIVPVGNLIIVFFNKLYNAVVSIINWGINAINSVITKIGIAAIGTIAYKNEQEGTLKPVEIKEPGDVTYDTSKKNELEEANKALKENKELFTKASQAANAYATELTSVVKAAASFYESLQDIGSDIAGMLVDNLVDGLSGDDFMFAIEEYIRKAVIQAAVYTASMQTQLANIGTAIAQAIASGSTDYSSITSMLQSLYDSASEAAAIAQQIVEGAFASYETGTISVPGNQLAVLHNKEMVLPSDMAQEARTRGISIAPIDNISRSRFSPTPMPIIITSMGVIELDGREIGRAAWQTQDEFARYSYGN